MSKNCFWCENQQGPYGTDDDKRHKCNTCDNGSKFEPIKKMTNRMRFELMKLSKAELVETIRFTYDKCTDMGEKLEYLLKTLDSRTDEKQGEWVVCGDGERVPFMCTHCGKTTSWYHKQTAKYCPNCGARMKGEEI